MLIPRSTATKQVQRFRSRVPQLVFLPWAYGDGVADIDLSGFALNPNPARATSNKINLLGLNVIVLLRAATDRQACLGQTLIPDAGISVSQQFPDFRAILGNKRRDLI